MGELQNGFALMLATTKQTPTTSESKSAYATTQHLGYDRFEYRAHREMMATVTTRSQVNVQLWTTDILRDPILIQIEVGACQ